MSTAGQIGTNRKDQDLVQDVEEGGKAAEGSRAGKAQSTAPRQPAQNSVVAHNGPPPGQQDPVGGFLQHLGLSILFGPGLGSIVNGLINGLNPQQGYAPPPPQSNASTPSSAAQSPATPTAAPSFQQEMQALNEEHKHLSALMSKFDEIPNGGRSEFGHLDPKCVFDVNPSKGIDRQSLEGVLQNSEQYSPELVEAARYYLFKHPEKLNELQNTYSETRGQSGVSELDIQARLTKVETARDQKLATVGQNGPEPKNSAASSPTTTASTTASAGPKTEPKQTESASSTKETKEAKDTKESKETKETKETKKSDDDSDDKKASTTKKSSSSSKAGGPDHLSAAENNITDARQSIEKQMDDKTAEMNKLASKKDKTPEDEQRIS